jgi:hypothetical protein
MDDYWRRRKEQVERVRWLIPSLPDRPPFNPEIGVPMISPEELAALRQRIEHPEQPLVGGLGTNNYDTHCDFCCGQGKSEGNCSLPATEQWIVIGIDGGTYHIRCALVLGWAPSENERRAMTDYPKGPYR